ncbi:tRNA epoxyqueuosine(34) reductase QueG [Teredinibacter sp. KSP-S5-2]|uniref:tRNA epoxyqueuosine(34) reductase QueG n=1 Tax=Teredinibacter sp. KSP-S5-2 TaxID=3034506 RepID=UPI002935061B|nr:tRNA epoxyqueuosine(34) reductase QueG [Teredinibacter sp. KSP-S5-2]WNO08179.1 tRNA epoxyqueuosine(34) reductase QueG [Teredinibacter sp. KSP-S5-2]
MSTSKLDQLTNAIKNWAKEEGFQQVGITKGDLTAEQPAYEAWLKKGYHADMQWMAENKEKRLSPALLHPNTQRVISFRMNYLPPDTEQIKILKSPTKAYVSRYALGRDYHKLIRKRLAKIATKIEQFAETHLNEGQPEQRPFVDSAPVLERPLAAMAGLGWTGKHTLIIHPEAGSWFFLGEIFTSIPLPVNEEKVENKCGDCEACLKVCPTDAFPQPYVLDAGRCISYLTIENKGSIPEEFREPMGNRVFGCDDCQAICPWNKYASFTEETDFHPRHQLDISELIDLFNWDEKQFLDKTAGSPIRRIGYQNWLRNLAVGLGNAPSHNEIGHTLEQKKAHCSELVREHIDWALTQQHSPNRKRKRKIKKPDASN